MPRTTINLDPSVLKELKSRQKREHKSLGQVASELLAGALREDGTKSREPFHWYSKDMKPLIDLDDKEALWRVLDEDELHH